MTEELLLRGLHLWLNGWAWLGAGLVWAGPFALLAGGFGLWLLTQPLPVWRGGARISHPVRLREKQQEQEPEAPRYQVR